MMHDYEVVVTDTKLNFRPANVAEGSATSLRFGDDAADLPPAHERHPAGRQGRGPRLGPEGQEGRQRQREQPADDLASPASRAARWPATSAAARPSSRTASATTTAEANEIAKSTLQRMADAYFEADGVAIGNPALKAGSQGQGRGRRLEVRRRVHDQLEHALLPRRDRGYQTHFQISGRSSRTLTELIRPPEKRDWAAPASWSAW